MLQYGHGNVNVSQTSGSKSPFSNEVLDRDTAWRSLSPRPTERVTRTKSNDDHIWPDTDDDHFWPDKARAKHLLTSAMSSMDMEDFETDRLLHMVDRLDSEDGKPLLLKGVPDEEVLFVLQAAEEHLVKSHQSPRAGKVPDSPGQKGRLLKYDTAEECRHTHERRECQLEACTIFLACKDNVIDQGHERETDIESNDQEHKMVFAAAYFIGPEEAIVSLLCFTRANLDVRIGDYVRGVYQDEAPEHIMRIIRVDEEIGLVTLSLTSDLAHMSLPIFDEGMETLIGQELQICYYPGAEFLEQGERNQIGVTTKALSVTKLGSPDFYDVLVCEENLTQAPQWNPIALYDGKLVGFHIGCTREIQTKSRRGAQLNACEQTVLDVLGSPSPADSKRTAAIAIAASLPIL